MLSGCRPGTSLPDGSGTIECTQVQVAPPVGGRLLKLTPQEGAVLKRGDLVAQVDPADYVLKRDEAKAALAQAQAQLELMQAGSRPEDIRRGRAEVRQAKALADAAAADLKRTREVFEKQSATAQQLDAAQAQAESTAAVLAATEQMLARMLAGNRPEEIRVAETQVQTARAKLATAEKAIADCTVSAPMDGIVTTRSREEGEMVSTGTSLITLSRLEEVWLSVYVPETRLGQVRLGQPARVKLDGGDRMFSGTVTFISPEAEFTPKNVQTPEQRTKLVYRVKITLKNADGIFKPGMPADGYLREAQ
jgi:HlyD family secretion protein